MVWGREYPPSLITVFGSRETFTMLRFRQQAQQSVYPFYSPSFAYSDYASLATNEIRKNGLLVNSLRHSAASMATNFTNSFLISACSLDENSKTEQTDGMDQETKKTLLQCGCIGLSSAIGAAVSHPLAVMGTWQMVQDIPVESRMFFPLSRFSMAIKAVGEASNAIKTSKKTYYDGLFATVSYSVLFEVTKFGFSKKLYKTCGISNLTKQIEHVDARAKKEGNGRAREEYVKRSTILRWRRIALSGYLNYVASVGAGLLWFPLETIALRMQAQGSSFRFPNLFASAGEVVADQGVVSLYSGAPTFLLSFLSETGFAALTYIFVIMSLELMPPNLREQVGHVLSVMESGQFF